MNQTQTIEVPIAGMDCTECTQTVQRAISSLAGVRKADVFLSSEKAIIQLDPALVKMTDIRTAVSNAGYSVPEQNGEDKSPNAMLGEFSRRIFTALGLAFGTIILLVVGGEWLGLFKNLTQFISFPVGVILVLISGSPIFLNVIRATLKRQVISHALMSIGALAALFVGEWTTAMVVVFFMHIGNYTEKLWLRKLHAWNTMVKKQIR